MPFELRNLKINRGSLVDKGANQASKIVLFKRDDVEETAVLPGTVEAKEGDPVDAELKKTIDELTKQTAETNGALKTLKADLENERAENAELRKRLAGVKPTEKPDETPVTKADLSKLDSESREAIEKAMKEAKESREEISKLRAEAALNMETARIEKQYPNIVEEKAIKFAKLLLKHEKGSDERESIEDLIEAANSQAEEILSEHGTSIEKRYSQAGGDPLAKIQTIAEEIRKADPKLNRAQAFSLARKRNPELARQLREES